MRLLLVTNDFPPRPGGIQQYLVNLVAHLPAEVLVIAPSDERSFPEDGVVRFPRTFMWPTQDVREFVGTQASAFNADAVLFGAPHPLAMMGHGLARDLGIPFGVLAHGAEVTMPAAAPGLRQVMARSLRSAAVRFAVSRFTAAKVEAFGGAPVVYVGAGVDTGAFTPLAQPPHNDPPIVGCVSRFVPRKGQDVLIEAVSRLDRPVELLLVGGGRREVALRRLAADLSVRARFEIDVPWEALPGLYRQMDAFCMPCRSRWGGLEAEGLGLVFLEAAACGLPVLVGDSGGAPETVLPGETGFIVRDADDIAEGIAMLLDAPERRLAMGRAGRERVANEFTWPKVADRLIRGFEEVL